MGLLVLIVQRAQFPYCLYVMKYLCSQPEAMPGSPVLILASYAVVNQ